MVGEAGCKKIRGDLPPKRPPLTQSTIIPGDNGKDVKEREKEGGGG